MKGKYIIIKDQLYITVPAKHYSTHCDECAFGDPHLQDSYCIKELLYASCTSSIAYKRVNISADDLKELFS
ncbi:MAG: hypothetical protein OEV44_02890 [Spirochaetota bacterium]|nr:hypothetical protein [Spirochaetota bacterium]